jgi:hypothetical protein
VEGVAQAGGLANLRGLFVVNWSYPATAGVTVSRAFSSR